MKKIYLRSSKTDQRYGDYYCMCDKEVAACGGLSCILYHDTHLSVGS